MKFIFIENTINFTSISLDLKAIDSAQKNFINFVVELKKRGHDVTVYNNTKNKRREKGILWDNLSNLRNNILNTDILIVCDDEKFINLNVNASLKIFWITSLIDNNKYKNILINLLKNKFILMHSSYSMISALPETYNYIPKVFLEKGVGESFFKHNNFDITSCKAFVTTHPLRGLDWLIDLWVNIISTKIPWAELHIYSKNLFNNKFLNNIKINNLKLKLIKYKNNGIYILKPLSEYNFLKNLKNYRVHLNPSDNLNFSSLSLLESQAAGIPIISKKYSEIENYVNHNETGYLTNDVHAFSKKTIDLLTDNSLFLKFRNNSKLNNRIKTWKEAIEKFESKINENIIYR